MEFGFDVVSWAKLGLIDMVIPSPNWFTTDNDMPLKMWGYLMEPYNVSVVGCLEINLLSSVDYKNVVLEDYLRCGMRIHSYETYCASAVNVMSQAPGALYLFNCMDYLAEKCDYKKILNTLGDIEKIVNLPRRHIVTYSDTCLLWQREESILPLEYDDYRCPKWLKIVTGRVPENKRCILRLGFSNEAECEVFVNSEKTSFIGVEECEAPVLTKYPLYCFEIPCSAMQDCVQIAEIVASNVIIDYADIMIY